MLSHLFPGRIKICGITNLDDALAAVDCGVRTLGFVFHPASPRCASPRTVRQTIEHLAAYASSLDLKEAPQPDRSPKTCQVTSRSAGPVICVGVFVDQPPQLVRAVANECGLTAVQCHGNEPDAWLADMGVPAIKAVRVRTAADLGRLGAYPAAATLLLDAWSAQAAGGTGASWDWSLAAALPRLDKPFVLAGGLTPDNVASAIRLLQPAAVDVSSGVETAPGRKDYDTLRRFVAAAEEAFHESSDK